jgi:hypothetical protein
VSHQNQLLTILKISQTHQDKTQELSLW